eukprot:TRINITY_DN1845_c1_g1_i2.p1 TRINITY_DN1845_c1_g1~~TRINITY_DN1845_c1_g1_i2.p1  ORF type:complete len:1093 (+),score=196.30 TRINITY_DN1845_c1_g1_i2:49-3327(+)
MSWLPSQKCMAPMKMEAIGKSHEDVAVSWEPNDGSPVSYKLYCIETELLIEEYEKWVPRGDDQEKLYLAAEVGGTATTALITKLKESCQYLIVLFAIDPRGRKVRCTFPEYQIIETAATPRPTHFSFSLKQNALVAAASISSPSSALYCSSVTSTHCIVTASIINRICTKALTADNTIIYSFREQPSDTTATTDFSDVVRSINRDLQNKDTPSICFTGYELGGVTAIRAMVSVLKQVPEILKKSVACITFGMPVVGSLTEEMMSRNIDLKHCVLQVVHAEDPVAMCGTYQKGKEWLLELQELLKPCDQLSQSSIFSVPVHRIENKKVSYLGYEKTVVDQHLSKLGTLDQVPTSHVFGRMQFLKKKNPFSNATFDLKTHLVSAYSTQLVLDEPPGNDESGTKTLFPGLKRVQLKPIALRSACSLLVTNVNVELKVFGKNLSVVVRAILEVTDTETEQKSEIELDIGVADDHKLTATQQVGRTGYLGGSKSVSVILLSNHGNLRVNDVCCDSAADQLPEWALRYADMPVPRLIKIASEMVTLKVFPWKDESTLVTKSLLKLLRSLLTVSRFTELHNKEAIGRNLILKTRTSIISENPVLLQDDDEDPAEGSPHEIFQRAVEEEDCDSMAKVVTHSVDPFCSHHIRFSLIEKRGAGTSIAVLTGKTLALAGGVVALLNPVVGAGELAIAAVAATHFTDYFLNLCDLPKTYAAKLTSILETLDIKTDCIPDKVYYHEALICGRLDELLGSGNPLKKDSGDENEIREEFVKQIVGMWNKLCVDPEGGGWLIAHCVEADRSTFARLLYTIAKIHEIRKLLSKTFVVQLVGATNAGKSTIASSVFDLPAVSGAMADGITKEQFGYQTSFNKNLIIVDNPGMHDVTALDHNPVILDYASYYIIAQDWGSGLRNLHFAMCLAEIQAADIPFRLLITKSDQMVMSENWKKLRVLRWRDEQLPLLNEFLVACKNFLSHSPPSSSSDEVSPSNSDKKKDSNDIILSAEAIKSLKELKTRWGTTAVQKIGAPISATDCILCGLNVLPDKEFHSRRRLSCRTAGIQMVPELQDTLTSIWGSSGFDVSFPAENKQDLCDAGSDDDEE